MTHKRTEKRDIFFYMLNMNDLYRISEQGIDANTKKRCVQDTAGYVGLENLGLLGR